MESERDALTGIYPFVARPSKEEEVTADGSGYRVTTIDRPRDPITGMHEIRRHASARSLFAFFAREEERVVSYRPDQPEVFLRNIQRNFDYTSYGNLSTQETRWLNQAGSLVDSATVTTNYVLDGEHLQRWLINLPRSSSLLGFGEALSTRTRYFRYAEDADGTGLLPYSGRPEAIIESAGVDGQTKPLTRSVTYDVWGNTTDIVLSGEVAEGTAGTRSTHIEYDDLHLVPRLVRSNNHDVTLHSDYVSLQPVGSSQEGRIGETVRQWNLLDGFGRPIAIYDRDGSSTTFDYPSPSDANAPMAIQVTNSGAPGSKILLDVLGREVRREFDGFDKTLISETHYDELGRVDRTSRARAGGPEASDSTLYTYDTGGRPTSVTLPDGTTLGYCYHHNVRCERDQRGFVSCEVYNTHGRVIHRVEPLPTATTPGSCAEFAEEVAQTFSADSDASAEARAQYVTTRYHYCPLGNVLSVTDAAGHVTRFERDDRGELVRNLIHPDSGTWNAVYNAFNELQAERSPDGAISVFHYDTLGRMIERVDEGEIRQFTRFAYDYVNGAGYYGALFSTVSADGVEQLFEHDRYGRPSTVTVTHPQTLGPQPLVKHIGYDDLQRPSLISYDSVSGSPLSYRIRYNDNGYVAGYDRPDPQQPDMPQLDTPLWTAETTDDYGLLNSLRYGNAVMASRTYHAGNSLLQTETLSPSGQELQYLSHAYTADHRLELLTRRDDATTTSVTRYDYDALKRVKSAVTHDGSESGPVRLGEGYEYDVTGNVMERRWWDGATVATPRTWTYSYADSARPHAVSSIAEGMIVSQFDYQPDGSMRDRSSGVQPALHIDSNRRHMPYRLADAEDTVFFSYDAFDYRTRKSTNTGETLYLDDHYSRHSLHLVSGSEERLVIGSAGAAVAEIVRSASGTESITYLHNDGLGSPVLVTNESGQVVQRREYEAFGQRSRVTGDASATTRPDFTGQERDADFGLINLRARLYDPATGRFLAIDPLIEPRGGSQRLNPYSYVNNDPLNHTDRSGLCPECAPPASQPQSPQLP